MKSYLVDVLGPQDDEARDSIRIDARTGARSAGEAALLVSPGCDTALVYRTHYGVPTSLAVIVKRAGTETK